MPQQFEIYIEKIVVEGINGINGPAFRAALEAQLSALLNTPDASLTPGAEGYTHRLNGGSIQLSDTPQAAPLAQSVAANIFQSIQHKTSTP